MSDADRKPRPWQEIAGEASREKDPKRLIELVQELELALDERQKEWRKKQGA